ncbi:MAG TPA: ImmA/IrrE family metallo-endopeptidase [Solirubrobacteraceae bacterium]|nr:ImmA/IrrE family metallo-endopeptidase [Solirubrobacteraceae bacterium]
MRDATPSPRARERISELCTEVLRRSGAAGVIPTPLDAVQHAVGVRERIDLGRRTRTPVPAVIHDRVLGAVWFEERVVFLDARQAPGRRRFTLAHELAHVLCPWHEAVFRLDTAQELFGSLVTGIEAEANFAASELIFQGRRFAMEARGEEPALTTAFALGERFGASRQAAVHQFVAGHEAPVAVAIAGRWPGRDGQLPIWRSIESASFRRRFGRFAPAGGFSTRDERGGSLASAIDAARRSSDPVTGSLRLRDRGGRTHRFRADVFNNRHCHLVFVAGARR